MMHGQKNIKLSFTMALDSGDWSTSHRGCSAPGERAALTIE